ncbi:hypothetical protein FA95DRAFT_770443 [Auriscalpium vulgare]|uniref:Uncharacterized protein n=1 Tax=Auriscalpium vulgare TaxID=40419 RepID=A0ACB8RBZ9_9AGAM|nr:hypothetical protein FA95DRAFT_770443 [Auriscalpium vulgare]
MRRSCCSRRLQFTNLPLLPPLACTLTDCGRISTHDCASGIYLLAIKVPIRGLISYRLRYNVPMPTWQHGSCRLSAHASLASPYLHSLAKATRRCRPSVPASSVDS